VRCPPSACRMCNGSLSHVLSRPRYLLLFFSCALFACSLLHTGRCFESIAHTALKAQHTYIHSLCAAPPHSIPHQPAHEQKSTRYDWADSLSHSKLPSSSPHPRNQIQCMNMQCTHVHEYMYVYIPLYIICIHMYVYKYISIYAYVYIYKYVCEYI